MTTSDTLPLCSVCVANYNGAHYLSECVDSIMAQQGFPGKIEIIVHDDASTDDSVELLKRKYPQVRLLKSEENVGFCVSNNRMVKLSNGKFVLLLNNDALLHSDAMKTLYEGSQTYGAGILGLSQYDAESGELLDIGSIFDPFLNPIPNKDENRQDVGMIIGACLWLPRILWNEIGGFPDWFGSMAEDMYLCCVARLWGYPVKALADSGFDHWVGRSFGGGKITKNNKLSTTLKRRTLSERNKTFVMIITYPGASVWVVVSVHLLVLCFEGLILSLIKWKKRIFLEIYWNCLKGVYGKRYLLRERRRSAQQKLAQSYSGFFAPFSIIPHKIRMLLKYGLPKLGD